MEETIPPEEKEQFMSTAEMLREEGRAEGRQEGHLSALRDAVFDLLETRFTEIPAALRESVLRVNDSCAGPGFARPWRTLRRDCQTSCAVWNNCPHVEAPDEFDFWMDAGNAHSRSALTNVVSGHMHHDDFLHLKLHADEA